MYGQAEEMERVIRKHKNRRISEVSHLDENQAPSPYLRAHHLAEGIRFLFLVLSGPCMLRVAKVPNVL